MPATPLLYPRSSLNYVEVVFILPSAVLSMEEHHLLAQPMNLKEIVETTHDIVSTFAALSCFISEEIHLLWQGLTVHTKHSALYWCEKVDRSWLEWI